MLGLGDVVAVVVFAVVAVAAVVVAVVVVIVVGEIANLNFARVFKLTCNFLTNVSVVSTL